MIDWGIYFVWIFKIVNFFIIVLTGVAYFPLAELKFAGFIKDRLDQIEWEFLDYYNL